LRHPQKVRRLVVLNTAGFTMPDGKTLPWQLALGRHTRLGALLIRGLNAFAGGAALDGGEKAHAARGATRLPVALQQRGPTASAPCAFVQDIPLSAADPAWASVAGLGRCPGAVRRPSSLCCVGAWAISSSTTPVCATSAAPGLRPKSHEYADAGHYVLEDAADRIIPTVKDFLQRHPL
jgi:pimeloyl-ACP methyl ester carboxylesterase